MGSRLIFRPVSHIRRGDGENKLERLNGLASLSLRIGIQENPGACLQWRNSRLGVRSGFTRLIQVKRLPRKTSKFSL